MSVKHIVMLLPLVLAACNSGPNVTAKNASVEEVQNKVADAAASGNFISPGAWESKIVADIEMPNMDKMPAETVKAMKEKMQQGQTVTSCVTPEEVKSPKAGMFGGDKSCRYDHFTMAGGTIDAKMTCDRAGQKQVMTVKGTYSATTYHTEVKTEGAGGKFSATVDAKRTGQCTGKEQS